MRERKEDIGELARHFIEIKSKEMNIRKEIHLSDESLKMLQRYDWPGNVRELENVIERALILGKGEYPDFENAGLYEKRDREEESIATLQNHKTLDELIKYHIEKTLELTGCRINGAGGAAELLGMNPSKHRSKMKKLDIRINKTGSGI